MAKATRTLSAPQSRRNFLTNVILPSAAALPLAAAGVASASQAAKADDPIIPLIDRYYDIGERMDVADDLPDDHPLWDEHEANMDVLCETAPTSLLGAAMALELVLHMNDYEMGGDFDNHVLEACA